MGELLEAAASTKQQLRCIALSHLQLQHWPTAAHSNASAAVPEDESASSPDSPIDPGQQITPISTHVAGSGLQVLALHNCSGITAEGLQVVASACPQLRLLFLGGSTLQVPSLPGGSSGSSYIPLLNSIPRSRAATIAGVLRKAPSCHHPSAHLIAAQLVELVLQLPQLLLLEITFLPHGVRSEVRALLADSSCDRPVHVLDLCESKSITAAIEYGSKTGVHTPSSVDGSARDLKSGKLKIHLALLLEAAANCSNAARQTPLHVAADVDDVGAVEVRSSNAPTVPAAPRSTCLARYSKQPAQLCHDGMQAPSSACLCSVPIFTLFSHLHTVLGLLHRDCCSWAVG